MTSTGIKFYKFNNSTESATKITSAKAVEGAVIYLVDVRELWIGGSTPKLVIKGANDVTFSNNVLTITHYDNAGTATTQTLNFSDVASASQTMAVFEQIYTKMGLTGASHDTLDYTGTNYLTSATNLVNADKALDTAIHTNTHKGAATGAVYDTEHLSSTWTTVVTTNTIAANDTLDADIDKLDKKVAQLANEVIANEQVTQEAFTAVANSVGLESDMSLDLSSASQTGAIHGDTDVKSALIHLDNAISTNQLDVQVEGSSIVNNNVANLGVANSYNASTNKIATVATVTNAINALDVNTDKGAASISGSTITINAVQQEDGIIKDGGTTTINLDGTYDATDNKIATKSTVTTAIGALDTQSDVQAVDYTAATSSTGAKLTFKGVSETDGVIAQGSGTTELQFAKVATSGNAEDVTYNTTSSQMTATNVQGAIDELDTRIDALEGSFDVIKSTNAATTPYGVTWTDNTDPEHPQTVTGTLEASATTFHKIYLVPVDSTGTNKYAEYITTKETSGQSTTYAWERLGTIDVDLTGYVKTVTVNGKEYAVDNNGSVNITLTDVITGVTGETAISGGDTNYVKVAANTVKDTTNGTNVTTLSTTVKIEEVADGIVKDGTASYTEGHYVIENGKLVSAVGKSTGDTYTISANDGLTKASDVAAYVESKTGEGISSLDVADYAQATVDTTTTAGQTSITIKGIKEEDGKIGASASAQDTTIVADGTYDATNNKLATKSTIDNAIATLDADVTSQQAAVATVKVVEADGVITTVNVTNVSAGVTYTASTASTAPNLAASTSTGAVTGADIATIKSYVDDRANLCWEEYN